MFPAGGDSLKDTKDYLSVGFYDHALCTRCGTCYAVCPADAVTQSESLFPRLIDQRCTECGLCRQTCPGGAANFPQFQEMVFGSKSNPKDYTGHYLQAYAARSCNNVVRDNGASGGVVTELLLYLLESGRIDGAVVTVMDRENPARARSIIATNAEQILEAQQSKYIVVPVNKVLRQVKDFEGKLAFVGLPCHIHGLRKLQKLKPKIYNKIVYVIGLFCLTTLEPYVIRELERIKGDRGKRLSEFYFRQGQWPGNIVAKYTDGSTKKLHYSNFKDGAINYLTRLYSPRRCQLCSDGTAEFADISVADAWMRNPDGSYKYPGHSTVLARSPIGEKWIKEAITNNRIRAELVSGEMVYYTYRTLELNKKKFSQFRAARRKGRGEPWPKYSEFPIGATRGERILELTATGLHRLGEVRIIRQMLLAILLSGPARVLIKARKHKKERIATTLVQNYLEESHT